VLTNLKGNLKAVWWNFYNNPYNRFNVEFISEDDFNNISGIFEPNYGEWYTVIHM